MGWAAYQFKRSTGENIVLYVPNMAEKIDYGHGYHTLAELLSYPDFPIEATVLASGESASNAKAFGFPKVLDLAQYAGETFTLNNGSYFKVSEIDSNNTQYVYYYKADGKSIFSERISKTQISWLPGLFADNREILDYNRTDVSKDSLGQAQFFLYNGYFPSSYTSSPQFYIDAQPVYITSDPYGDGGETSTGGGVGDFDSTSDPVDIPGLPSVSSTDAGFITLFNPTSDELRNLASYMWSDLFDVNGWKKVFADPMQAILGLSIVPVNVPSAGTRPVKVGNISTDVAMTVAASQYVTVDCGTLNVKEFWGAYLDYDPYTKVEIYLPYIGIHALSTDDVMGKLIHVVYHVDILSGSCCAYVKCGDSVLYSFAGQCTSSVPITGDNWTNVINGALSIAGSIGSMVATGGASAPSAIGNIASAAINSMKPSIEKSGSMGGTGGMLGIQTPYLILTRPRQAVPRDQNAFIGYPSYITSKLGDLEGYTEIDSIHLENIGATESELSEIESILKGGVIF